MRPSRTIAVPALLVLLVVAGCTGATRSGTSAGETADAVSGARQGAAGLAAPQGSGSTGAQPAVTLLSRDVIQRAVLTVHARDIGEALARTRRLVSSVQGMVSSEQTETGRRGRPRLSTLTLRVPVDAFGDVLASLRGLGRVGSQQVSAQDVTTEVIDVEARIISAQRTLKRVRDLLAEADDFSEILSLEGELSRREADLASLEAQQEYLDDQTSLSTIDLTLLPRERPERDEDPAATGFVGGLGVGWDALVGVVTVALTALGVLAPLLLLLVPLALLLWWAGRRVVRRLPRQTAAG
ncbi:MAG: DUF4349 domain-containing protein [Nocardioidaceae bacterium]